MANPQDNPMQLFAAPRCGAKTRRGTSCQSPVVHGKQRCRMHGGAAGSGAPRGNHNALKSGAFSREMLGLQAEARAVLKQVKTLMKSG